MQGVLLQAPCFARHHAAPRQALLRCWISMPCTHVARSLLTCCLLPCPNPAHPPAHRRYDLKMIKLGSGNQTFLEGLLNNGLKFSQIFNATAFNRWAAAARLV